VSVYLVDKLEKLVEQYNLGTLGVEAFFEALKPLEKPVLINLHRVA